MNKFIIISFCTFMAIECDNEEATTPSSDTTTNGGNTNNGSANSSWLIPIDEVFDGGPGKDGIPALEYLEKTVDDDFLTNSELIVGFYDGTNAVAYPHQVLDWHQIVNDELNGFPYAITYCPLTGTGIGWSRTINGQTTTYGVSGLLHNNNLIPYDRSTDSNWSQMKNECVNGELQGASASTFMVLETNWATWKSMYPQTQIISTNTDFGRPYGTYPYGDYKTNNDNLVFPLNPDDVRLERKERVHGVIIRGQAKIYRFSAFNNSNQFISDTFFERDIIVVGNTSSNFMVSFYNELTDGSTPEFTAIDEGRNILKDSEGNKWDIFGYATEGPRTGQRLIPTKSYMGYWFSWGTFYPEPDIYE